MTTRHKHRTHLIGSCRLVLSIISCLGFLNTYSQRVILSQVILCMVKQTVRDKGGEKFNRTNWHDTIQHSDKCELYKGALPEDRRNQKGEFAWSRKEQGYLLSAFFWGYVTTHLVGGWLSQRIGGKRVVGYSILICSVATFVMPFAARIHYVAFFVLRIVLGIFQGMVWPSLHDLWSRWAPPLERQKLTSLCYAGSQIGIALTLLCTSFVCENLGWPAAFYISGSLGILWSLIWFSVVFDSPQYHPRISSTERSYITSSLSGSIHMTPEKSPSTPWRAMLTSRSVWAIVVTHSCANWTVYRFMTTIPTYNQEVLNINHELNGVMSSLPFVGFFVVTIASATLYDFVVTRKLLSVTLARKAGNTLGMMVPSVLAIIISFLDCTNVFEAVALTTACVSMCGFQWGAGFLTNPSDIAPQYAGIVFGFSNTFATISGIMAPTVTGYITADHRQSQWQIVFFIDAFFLAFGAFVFIMFADAKPKAWASDRHLHHDVSSVSDIVT